MEPSKAMLMMAIDAVGVGLLALVGDLAEGELLLELTAELSIGRDQLLARLDEGLARRDGAVRLDAQKDFRHVGMSDCSIR